MGSAHNGTCAAGFSVAEKDAGNNREAGVLVFDCALIHVLRVNLG